LKRVGCDTGVADGNWNADLKKLSMASTNMPGTKLDIKVASLDALDAVRSKPDRVCPRFAAREKSNRRPLQSDCLRKQLCS